jgi:hypothetical protein
MTIKADRLIANISVPSPPRCYAFNRYDSFRREEVGPLANPRCPTSPFSKANHFDCSHLSLLPALGSSLSGNVSFENPRYEEYARNIVNRLAELRGAISRLDDELIRD